jgi:ATP-dependent protease ClpP protease subunit
MYGQIVTERPRNWWTGELIEGDYIALDDFLADLDKIAGAKRITIRLNSLGGEVFAALPIYNRLRELKAEKTVIVDGVAMSSGAFLMCAGDTVKVSPASIVMIHRSSVALWGDYNAGDLREFDGVLAASDKAMASAFTEKSGLSEGDVLALMEQATYWTGREAVERGFADELVEGEAPQIAASADGRSLVVCGRSIALPSGMAMPDNIPTVNSAPGGAVEIGDVEPGPPGNIFEQGGSKDMTVEEVVRAERERLRGIDEIAALYDGELVAEAKFGETACGAAELALRAAQDAAKSGKRFLESLAADAQNSGAAAVGAAPAGDPTQEPEQLTGAQLRAKGREMAKAVSDKSDKGDNKNG